MFKRENREPIAEDESGQPASKRTGGAATASVRIARGGLLAALLVLGSGLAGGCSDSMDCKPALPQGAVYEATLLSETATSDACHVVVATRMSPFRLTVGATEPTASRPDCSVTPAAAPPPQLDVTVVSCVPSDSEMLGVYCQIVYKAGCDGHMLFYFTPPQNGKVDWGADVIEGLLFRIQDFSPNCFSDRSGCLDEYTARLKRVQ